MGPSGGASAFVPAPLHHPGFRRFWSGETVSLFGDQVSSVALPLVALLVLHADAAQMGYLVAAGLAPYLVLSVHAGSWSDRWRRQRRVMIAADLVRAALVALIPVAYLLSGLSMGQLYVTEFLTGTCSVFFSVSYSTVFAALVPAPEYLSAQSLISGSRAVAALGGPGVAGVLVQLLSAPLTLLVDAGSFLVSAVFLHRVALDRPCAVPRRQGLFSGLRFLAGSRILRAALAATTTINFFNYMYQALFLLYLTRALRLSPAVIGLLVAVGAAGALAGSALVGILTRHVGIGPTFLVGCVLFPAPLMLVPAATGRGAAAVVLLVIAQAGTGLGMMILDVTSGVLFTAAVPERLRGRVKGAQQTVNYGVRPIGALIGGILGTTLGTHTTLWIATAAATLGGLWLVRSPLLRVRDVDRLRNDG